MLELIKNSIFTKHNQNDIKWIFMSAFDLNWNLLKSDWVIQTDKTLWEIVDLLYNSLFKQYEKNIKTFIIDIIISVNEEKNVQNILNNSTKQLWILLLSKDNPSKSWIILPDTKWVNTIKDALLTIKKKYWISWNVILYSFFTDRIVINL